MKIDWNTLQSKLSGEVLVAGDPGYEVARRPALARFADARPEAVVFATSATSSLTRAAYVPLLSTTTDWRWSMRAFARNPVFGYSFNFRDLLKFMR